MGAACGTAQHAEPSPAPAPAHNAKSRGLAESKADSTVQHIAVTPSKKAAQVQRTSAASSEDGKLLFKSKSVEQLAKQAEVESSGRSIARRTSKELEDATPQEALQDLLDGNARFMIGESDHPHQTFHRLQEIAPKQRPTAAILACADSRVPVELLFDQGFGDVFVCRIAGNIATAEEIASLEYAVLELGVKVIMIMGHSSCGAVKAALSGMAFPGFIDALVDHLDVAVVRAQSRSANSYSELLQAKKGAPDDKMVDLVICENAKYQVARCKRSTIILDAIKRGKCIIVPAVYDIKTGEVKVLQED